MISRISKSQGLLPGGGGCCLYLLLLTHLLVAAPALAAKPFKSKALVPGFVTRRVDLTNSAPIVTNLPLPTLTFSAPSDVRESQGSFQVDFTLTPPADNDLLAFVDSLLQFGGSAVAGLDYQHPFGFVVFPTGSSRGSLTVFLLNDKLPRPDRDLVLTGLLPAPDGTTHVAVVHIHDDDIVVPPTPADLSISMSVSPSLVVVGDTLDLSVALANAGPGPATNVVVAEVLPVGLELVSATVAGIGGGFDPVSGRWSIPLLGPGESRQLALKVRAQIAGTFTQSAEVMASSVPDPDSVPGNGNLGEDDLGFVVFKVDAPAPPPQADLLMEKEVGVEVTLPTGRKDVLVSPNPAILINTPAVFFLKVTNLGPDDAKDILVRETLPAGFAIIADAAPRGTAFNRAKAEWTIPRLASGGSITLRLDASTAQMGAFINRATVSAATADPVAANNAAAAPVRIVGANYCGLARLCRSTNTANINAEVTLTRAGKSFRTRTDAQGRFCFENMIPGNYKLQIAGDKTTGVQPIEEDPVTVDGTALIRPVDQEPITRIFLHDVIRIVGMVSQGGLPVADQKIIGTGDAEAVVAETDAKGQYILVGFKAGESVTVRPGPGSFPGAKFTPAEIKVEFPMFSPCELRANFVLTGGLVLAGRLQACDKTGPFIADAEIILSTSANPLGAKLRSGADGRFTLANLPPDTYTLTATHPAYNFANPLGTIKLKADTKPDIYFGQPIGVIAGRVVNQDGDGLPGIAVELRQNVRPFGLAATATTGNDGRFQFAANAAPAAVYSVVPKASRAGITFVPATAIAELGGKACAAYLVFKTRETLAEIVALEVVQVTQDWQNSAVLVAGKPTLVRAFLRAPNGADRRVPVSLARLLVSGDGGNATLRPKDGRGIEASNDYLTRRNSTETSLAFEVPTNRCQGKVTFTLEWERGLLKTAELPDQTAVHNNATTVNFQKVNPLPVLWALVNWTSGAKKATATLADLARHRSRIYHNLPISQISPPGRPLPFRWIPPKDPTDGSEVVEAQNRVHLDRELNKLATAIRIGGLLAGNPIPIPRDDLLFGVVTGTAMGGQASGIPGISGFADGSMDRRGQRNTPAHEVGHLLGRHHSVNSAFGFIVENGIRAKVGPCRTFAEDTAPDFPMDVYEDDPLQPVLGPMTQGIYKRAYGWDAGFSEYVSPFQTPDLMSYCEFKSGWAWPSLTTHAGMFAGMRSRYGPRQAGRAAAPLAGGPTLFVHGEISLDGTRATLAPLIVLPAGGTLSDPAPGPFTVRLLDNAGGLLLNQPFSPEFPVAEAGTIAPDSGNFELFLPVAPGMAAVEITLNDTILVHFAISAHAPVVQLTHAEVVANQIHLDWLATDEDNDPLFSTVEYSGDNGATWNPVLVEALGSTLELPINQFAGTSGGRFRVTVSDGFYRTTSTPSPAIAFPNQPPVVSIEAPLDGERIAGDHELVLRASALDLEDLELASVRWKSDLSGELGTGEELVVDTGTLAEGTHQITVTATDSGGLVAEASVRMAVIHQPGVPLTVQRDGESLVVSWPLAFSTWQLRASPEVDGAYWYNVEAPAVFGDDTVTVRLDNGDDSLFLRLYDPYH